MALARTLCLAVVAAASIAGGAAAADFPTRGLPPSVVQAPEAPPPEQLYAVLRGGFTTTGRTGYQIDSATPFPIQNVQTTYRSGLTGSIGVGYDMGEMWHNITNRVELELGVMGARVNSHTVATTLVAGAQPTSVTFSGAQASGTARAVFGFANYYLDLQWGRFRPFIGAGIGLATVSFPGHGTGPLGKFMDDGDMSLAWNVTAGVGFQINRAWTVEAAYRYIRIDDLNLSTGDIGAPGQRITSTTNLKTHQFMLGIRLNF